jgi:hypothetical protein
MLLTIVDAPYSEPLSGAFLMPLKARLKQMIIKGPTGKKEK